MNFTDEDGTIVAIGFSKFADIERGSTSEGDVQLIFLPNKDTQSIFPCKFSAQLISSV